MKRLIKKDNIILFLVYFSTSILFYIKQITSVLANPDSIWQGILYKSGWQWETSLGRFGIKFLQEARGYTVNTAVVSVMCILLLSIGCVLLTEILEITNVPAKLLSGALVLFSVNTGCLLTYYYCSDMYALSFLCVVVALYLFSRDNNLWYNMLGILLVAASAAIYQAYIGTLLTLFTLFFIRFLFTKDWSWIWKKAVKCGGFTGIGLLVYLVVNKWMLKFYQIQATDSRGFSAMGHLNFHQTLTKVKEAYAYFWQYYFGDVMINNGVSGRRGINVLYFAVLAVCVVIALFQLKGLWRKLLLLVLLLLLPGAVMSIHVMAPEADVLQTTGVLMLPTTAYVYLLAIVILCSLELPRQDVLCRCGRAVLYISEILAVYIGIILNLSGQVYLEYETQKMDSLASKISDAIEAKVDNSRDYRICILGSAEDGNYGNHFPAQKESLRWTTYYYGTLWSDYNGTQSCWREYILYHCGLYYNTCSFDEYQNLKAQGFFDSMSLFPDEQSVYVTDDNQVVIKLGNNWW